MISEENNSAQYNPYVYGNKSELNGCQICTKCIFGTVTVLYKLSLLPFAQNAVLDLGVIGLVKVGSYFPKFGVNLEKKSKQIKNNSFWQVWLGL